MPGIEALLGPLAALPSQYASGEISRAGDLAWRASLRDSPTTMPALGSLLDAYMRGWLPKDSFDYLTGSHGVNTQGAIGRDALGIREMYRHLSVGWQAILDGMVIRPGVDQTINAMLRGILTEDQFRQLARHQGTDPNQWPWMYDTYRSYLPVQTITQLYWRGLLDKHTWEKYVKRVGAYDSDSTDWLWELRHVIPDQQRLIQYAQIQSLGSDAARMLGLYDDMPAELVDWLTKQGSDWQDNNGTNWMHHAWAAHWRLPQSSELLRWYHLFRPGRLARYQAITPNIVGMTDERLAAWMGMDAVPSGVRDWMIASSYRPVRLQTIQRTYTQGPRRPGLRDWARELLLDASLHPDDAETMLDSWDEIRRLKREPDPDAIHKQRLLRAIKTRDNTVLAEYQAGITERADAVQTLIGYEWPELAASAVIGEIDSANRRKLTQRAVARVRREYLIGGYTTAAAMQLAQQAGLTPTAALQQVHEWQFELTVGRKHIGASRVIKMYTEHLLSREDAAARLQLLGFADPDVVLMIAEAELSIAKLAGTAARAESKQQMEAAAKLAAAQKKAAGLAAQLQKALAKQTPRATILKWYKDGIIGRTLAMERLLLIGLTPEVATLALDDALVKSKSGKAAKSAAGTSAVAPAALSEAPPPPSVPTQSAPVAETGTQPPHEEQSQPASGQP